MMSSTSMWDFFAKHPPPTEPYSVFSFGNESSWVHIVAWCHSCFWGFHCFHHIIIHRVRLWAPGSIVVSSRDLLFLFMITGQVVLEIPLSWLAWLTHSNTFMKGKPLDEPDYTCAIWASSSSRLSREWMKNSSSRDSIGWELGMRTCSRTWSSRTSWDSTTTPPPCSCTRSSHTGCRPSCTEGQRATGTESWGEVNLFTFEWEA